MGDLRWPDKILMNSIFQPLFVIFECSQRGKFWKFGLLLVQRFGLDFWMGWTFSNQAGLWLSIPDLSLWQAVVWLEVFQSCFEPELSQLYKHSAICLWLGVSWVILIIFGSFLALFGPFWSLLVIFGHFWSFYNIILVLFGPFWSFWINFRSILVIFANF